MTRASSLSLRPTHGLKAVLCLLTLAWQQRDPQRCSLCNVVRRLAGIVGWREMAAQ